MKLLNKIKAGFFAGIIATLITPGAQAVCEGKAINFVDDLNWTNMLPVTVLGGISVAGEGFGSRNSFHKMPSVCSCPQNMYPGVGVTYWSPNAIMETVSDPMCFVSLGESKFSSAVDPEAGSNGQTAGKGNHYRNVHVYMSDVMALLKMMEVVAKCTEPHEPFTISYMSEYDPLARNEVWRAAQQAEALLFASPLAQAASAFAGMLRTITRSADDPFFWTTASGKSAVPSTGYSGSNGNGVASSSQSIMDQIVYMKHRNFEWSNSVGPQAQCFAFPVGIPFPFQYRFDQFFPHKTVSTEIKTGVSPMAWATGFAGRPANIPVPGKTDRASILWKAEQCCTGI